MKWLVSVGKGRSCKSFDRAALSSFTAPDLKEGNRGRLFGSEVLSTEYDPPDEHEHSDPIYLTIRLWRQRGQYDTGIKTSNHSFLSLSWRKAVSAGPMDLRSGLQRPIAIDAKLMDGKLGSLSA